MSTALTKSAVLALGLLCGCELAVRIFFARSMSARFEYGYHPTSGFVDRDDGRVQLVRAGGRRFHPQQFPRVRPPGVFRVMVIGDSVPRGPSLAASYAGQLAERLRARGIKAECLNLAVPGYGAERSQIVLRQALQYQPSLVILHVNNSNEFEDDRDRIRAQAFKGWHPRNWPMKSLMIHRLYEAKTERVLWKWLPPEIRDQGAISDADAEITASMNPAKLREWDARVLEKTAEDAALAWQAGVPLLLLTQARLNRDSQGAARLDDTGLDGLVRPLTNGYVRHLSMKQTLEPLDFGSLFADASHLRPAGHEAMATALVATLDQWGLLPRDRP